MSLQSTDPIADLLTRIRNAIAVGKNEVRLPSSNVKLTVAKELVRAGYLADVSVEQNPRDENHCDNCPRRRKSSHHRNRPCQQAWPPRLRKIN